jgi:hypothetical protein
MKIHPDVTLDRITDAAENDRDLGFCIVCGADAHGVEPDARLYECEACGEMAVFGAEELLIMKVA